MLDFSYAITIVAVLGIFSGSLLNYFVFIIPSKNKLFELKKLRDLDKEQFKNKSSDLETKLTKSEDELFELKKDCSLKIKRLTEFSAKVSALEQIASNVPKLETEIQKQIIMRNKTVQENTRLEKQISELTVLLSSEKKHSIEKKNILDDTKNSMVNEFKIMVGSAFRNEGIRFAEHNKNQITSIVSPLKEQLGEFKKKVEDVYDKESRDRSILLNEILNLKTLNESISKDAINLTKALKSDIKTQGNWGELVLERLLELSGLQKGLSYDLQIQFKQPNGNRYRPDAIIRLPEGRDVIVDSKVSLKNYEKCYSSDNEAERKTALKNHIISFKSHIKGLSSKSYENLEGIRSLDFVLMFVPIEEAFFMAVREEASLLSEAFKKNVFIVSPSTLLVTLRTINNIWQNSNQNRNSAQIAKQAGEMYDKFTAFIDSIDTIGKQLTKATDSYLVAKKRLSSGRGNLIKRAQKLKSLGIKTKKSFPKSFLTDDF